MAGMRMHRHLPFAGRRHDQLPRFRRLGAPYCTAVLGSRPRRSVFCRRLCCCLRLILNGVTTCCPAPVTPHANTKGDGADDI